MQDLIKARQMEKYMRNQFTFYGIQAGPRRKAYQDFLREEKKMGEINWEFLDLCYKDSHREFQYLACDYLIGMKKFLEIRDLWRIQGFIQEKSWWDTVDLLHKVVGFLYLQNPEIGEEMLGWSIHEDFWLRRVAIDFQNGLKEKTDQDLLEKILQNNLKQKEFFINKAMGWSLREYSKTNPDWVRRFIKRNREDLSSLSVREASKYL